MNQYLRILLIAILASVLIVACTLPSGAPDESNSGNGDQNEVAPTPTDTPAPSLVQDCDPQLVTNVVSNVRDGPGTNYNIVGTIPQGGTAPVAGKNQDGTWWYIQFPGGLNGYAWIAASITTATCIPATLAIIAAPPPPAAPPAPNNPPPGNQGNQQPPTPTATNPGGPIIQFMPINPGILQLFASPTPTVCVPCLLNPQFIPIVPLGP